jgi:hypothetical protein
MNYWIDLFTGKTWEEFRAHGSKTTGFRQRMKSFQKRILPGDIFLCYLIGVMRWVGALKNEGISEDRSRIWAEDEFPVRFDVEPIIELDAENGVPMDLLAGKVAFFQGNKDKGKFKGFVRMSPNLFKRKEDGDLICDLLIKAKESPVYRELDPKNVQKRPTYLLKRKGKPPKTVLIPGLLREESLQIKEEQGDPKTETLHTQIQYELLELGASMGLDVWVARNDRSKMCNGKYLGDNPKMLKVLPRLTSDDGANKTIELIDVLWLKNKAIKAAFEIECTTSVYSGLLRMADLISLQPNLQIDFFLVAPEERRSKVEQEICRPAFTLFDKSLNEACGFISTELLMKKTAALRDIKIAGSLKDNFLKSIAEYFLRSDQQKT